MADAAQQEAQATEKPASPPPQQQAPAESPRKAEAAVVDELAAVKKSFAELAEFVGFGAPAPKAPPAAPCWMHPFGCPGHA